MIAKLRFTCAINRIFFAPAILSLALALPGFAATLTNHQIEMAPVAAGTYPVACSNLAHDTTRLAQIGGPVSDFWDGKNDRYVGDILLEAADTLIARPTVPNSNLYPGRRNSSLDFVVITCYPTDISNTRPDYILPDGQRLPRMQRAGQLPILAPQTCIAIFPPPAGCGRWPLIVFSHGLASSPVDNKSIDFLVRLASYGYIVSAPFHGDGRFSRLSIDDLSDVWYVITNFDRIVELQALRPFAVKSVIDLMLANPQFSPHVDAANIGGIGGSMGGATMTWLLGAELTRSYPGLSSTPTVRDNRIKAAVGYVPYAGQRFLPAFGDDNATAKNVSTPYLSISGTADTTAPIVMMEQAMNNFRGTRYQVALAGVEHTYRVDYADDVFGWVVPFFAAHLKGDRAALDRLTRTKNIRGAIDDNLTIDYTAPTALGNGEKLVDEFYNIYLRHFGLLANQSDKSFVDSGGAGPGWIRTTQQFKGYTVPNLNEIRPANQAPVCRFYVPVVNTHFYSAEKADCDLVKRIGGIYEGDEFWITRALTTSCPTGTLAVTRLYNNRAQQLDSNHRYTTSASTVRAMVREGWLDEGVVMCAPL
jgi:hypothetical protein